MVLTQCGTSVVLVLTGRGAHRRHGASVILVLTGHGAPVYQLLALSNPCAVVALPGHGAVNVSMSAHPHFVFGLWATSGSAQECFTPAL